MAPSPPCCLLEYFTRLMSKMSKRSDFSFHHRCGELYIIHLIFADDLMLFCKGDIKSITLMKRVLNAFSDTSGLFASQEKTTVYFGSVKEEVHIRSLQVTGFQKGYFPF